MITKKELVYAQAGQTGGVDETRCSVDEIWDMLDYKRDLVPDNFINDLCTALSYLPSEIVAEVIYKTIFIVPDEAGSGEWFSFRNVYFRNCRGFILLNRGLFRKSKISIAFTVAHEVAHFMKNDGRKSWKINSSGTKNSGEKYLEYEVRADRKAVEWLSKQFKTEDLLKQCHALKKEDLQIIDRKIIKSNKKRSSK